MVLVDGCITETGTYRQLLDKAGAFSVFLTTYFIQHRQQQDDADDDEDDPESKRVSIE